MIAKLRRNLSEKGLRGTMALLWRRLREGYVREEVIVLLKELGSIVEPKRTVGLVVESLEERHLPGLYDVNRRRGLPEADEYFASCVAKGFNGFVARRGEDLVGYYWWVDSEADPPHPDVWLLGEEYEAAVEPGDVYGSSLFLLEQHRGGGASNEFLYRVEARLRDRGYSRIWGYLDRSNRPARWLYSTRGYRQMWGVVNRRFIAVKTRQSFSLDGGDR
jgi:GNAT superfamily N-acetyltransferase